MQVYTQVVKLNLNYKIDIVTLGEKHKPVTCCLKDTFKENGTKIIRLFTIIF